MAAVSWLSVWVTLQSSFPEWGVWIPAVLAFAMATVWRSVAFHRMGMVLWILGAIAFVQIEIRPEAPRTAEAVRTEIEFEVQGQSREVVRGFNSWIVLRDTSESPIFGVGLLTTDAALASSATYRAVLELSYVTDNAERSQFWARPLGELTLIKPPPDASRVVSTIRNAFLSNLHGVSTDSKALVAGLAIGDRSLLNSELTATMKTLSLSHLVAVSGANLAIVAGAVFLILSLLGLNRLTRILGSGLAIFGYLLIVGPEPSVLRAGFMAFGVLIGVIVGRGNQSLNGLSISVILLVFVDPYLAVDFGFGLSVAATFGLLVFAPALFRILKARLPSFFAASLAVVVAAQIYTLPIILAIENKVSTFSILANLLVEPVVAPVTVLGIVAVLLSVPLPTLASGFSWIASLGTEWIVTVANSLAGLPGVQFVWLPQPYAGVISSLVILGLTAFVLTSRITWLFLPTLLLFASIGWSAKDHLRYSEWPDRNWQVLACDVGQGDALVVRSQSKVLLIDTGREPELLIACLRQAEVEHVDLLVITHFDADHVEAVPNLLAELTVQQALISGFVDDRPLASIVKDALHKEGVTTVTAQTGLEFRFGEGVVKILQPSLTAREASDSNDASIVLSAKFPSFSLLALGDLGEVGQQRLLASQRAEILELAGEMLVLKVSHHGSADQSNELTNVLKPDIALISAGFGNSYGHPRAEALDMLADSGALILRTDESGSIGLALQSDPSIFTAGKL